MQPIIAQTVTIDLASMGAMAAIAVAAVTISQFLLKLITRWVGKNEQPTANEVEQSMGCITQHSELLAKMAKFSDETQHALARMADGMDSFRESVQRSHEAMAIRQEKMLAKMDNIAPARR